MNVFMTFLFLVTKPYLMVGMMLIHQCQIYCHLHQCTCKSCSHAANERTKYNALCNFVYDREKSQ